MECPSDISINGKWLSLLNCDHEYIEMEITDWTKAALIAVNHRTWDSNKIIEFLITTLKDKAYDWYFYLPENMKRIFKYGLDNEQNPRNSAEPNENAIDIVIRTEHYIRGEFQGEFWMTDHQNTKDRLHEEKKMFLYDIRLCSMSEFEEYSCAYENACYEAGLNSVTNNDFKEQYFAKLPYPWNERIQRKYQDFLEANNVNPETRYKDSLGGRIAFARREISRLCVDLKNKHAMRKYSKNLFWKKNAPKTDFGCYVYSKTKNKKFKKKYKKYDKSQERPRRKFYKENKT